MMCTDLGIVPETAFEAHLLAALCSMPGWMLWLLFLAFVLMIIVFVITLLRAFLFREGGGEYGFFGKRQGSTGATGYATYYTWPERNRAEMEASGEWPPFDTPENGYR